VLCESQIEYFTAAKVEVMEKRKKDASGLKVWHSCPSCFEDKSFGFFAALGPTSENVQGYLLNEKIKKHNASNRTP
jgi:hypothetical protein